VVGCVDLAALILYSLTYSAFMLSRPKPKSPFLAMAGGRAHEVEPWAKMWRRRAMSSTSSSRRASASRELRPFLVSL